MWLLALKRALSTAYEPYHQQWGGVDALTTRPFPATVMHAGALAPLVGPLEMLPNS